MPSCENHNKGPAHSSSSPFLPPEDPTVSLHTPPWHYESLLLGMSNRLSFQGLPCNDLLASSHINSIKTYIWIQSPTGKHRTCVSLSVVSNSATPWTVAHQAPLSMGFSRQEYWSGLPCPPSEDLPNPGIEPRSPTLQVDSLSLIHQSLALSKPHAKITQGQESRLPSPLLYLQSPAHCKHTTGA